MAVQLTDEQGDVELDARRLVAVARYVLQAQRIPADMDVGVLLVDIEAITALNEAHMGVKGPTDVLAFPIDEPGTTPPDVPAVLGDVVVCPAIAHEQAVEHGRSPSGEVDYLLVHGLLHLMGMDHAESVAQAEMFGLTDDLLTSFETSHGADGTLPDPGPVP